MGHEMKHSIITAIVIFALSQSSSDGEPSTHLFMLSGQSNMAGLDPSKSFIPTVQSALGEENVTVVKDAHGGQPILRWYKDWKSADGKKPDNAGDLYDRLMKKVKKASENKEFDTVTFVWMQGESDTRQHGQVYAKSLRGLIEQLATDLGRDDVNVVIGRISDHDVRNARHRYWAMVRDAQVEVAEEYPRGAWVDTDDLNDGIDAKGRQIKDDVHYSVEGYRELGKRFAEKAIELIESDDEQSIPSAG